MSNIKQRDDFEAYQASKYVEWAKLDGVTPPQGPISEKQAFDEYIEQKTVSHKILPFIKSSPVAKHSVKKWGTSTNTGWFKSEVDFTGLGVGDFLTVVFAPEKILNNDNNETIAIYLEIISVSSSGDSFNTKGYGWSNYVDSYSKTESDAKYELKGAGGGGGGVVPTPVEVPSNDDLGEEVNGEFGLNLFNYIEMSNDPKFRVSGHTFMTNDHSKITKEDNEIKKIRVYNRIKDITHYSSRNKKVTLEGKVVESSESHPVSVNHKLKALLSFTDKAGNIQKKDIIIPANNKYTEQWSNPSTYGYLQFQIGGDTPLKGKIELDAYYGTIKPNRQDQKFVFKNYNGVDLYANGHGTKNVYKHKRWWDCIQYNLNVVNLKDCRLLNQDLTVDEKKAIYWVEAPEDCLTYAGLEDDTTIKKIKAMLADNLMTSNLCDITSEDADGTVGNPDKPFFLINPLTHPVYDKKKGATIEKLCFQIIIGAEYAYKWRNHLTQTQIIYPTQTNYDASEGLGHGDTYFTQLPLGGMIYVLNNGQRIETNKYASIKAVGNGIQFSQSPFGYPTILVESNNVASIIENLNETL